MRDEVIRRTKTLRNPTGRKPGGQERHEGSTFGERIQLHARHKRGSNIDATVKTLVVYLNVVMFLPYGRIAKFINEVFGLRISQGSFVN